MTTTPTSSSTSPPNHYNGFFYNLMPPYCLGYAATSIGDYGSQAGPPRRAGRGQGPQPRRGRHR